jgi:hypothetical protein
MDVANDVRALVLAADVAIVVADLPELFAVAFEKPRCLLLEGLEELGYRGRRRLVHDQVEVFRHDDIGVDAGVMTRTGLLESLLDEGFGVWIGEEWKAAITTEGNEVERFGLLISLETERHGMSVVDDLRLRFRLNGACQTVSVDPLIAIKPR